MLAGTVAVMDVFDTTVTLLNEKLRSGFSGSLIWTVGLAVPGGVVLVERKPVPVMVTALVAALLPELGLMAVTVGAGLVRVNADDFVTVCESGLVTFTS